MMMMMIMVMMMIVDDVDDDDGDDDDMPPVDYINTNSRSAASAALLLYYVPSTPRAARQNASLDMCVTCRNKNSRPPGRRQFVPPPHEVRPCLHSTYSVWDGDSLRSMMQPTPTSCTRLRARLRATSSQRWSGRSAARPFPLAAS